MWRAGKLSMLVEYLILIYLASKCKNELYESTYGIYERWSLKIFMLGHEQLGR